MKLLIVSFAEKDIVIKKLKLLKKKLGKNFLYIPFDGRAYVIDVGKQKEKDFLKNCKITSLPIILKFDRKEWENEYSKEVEKIRKDPKSTVVETFFSQGDIIKKGGK